MDTLELYKPKPLIPVEMSGLSIIFRSRKDQEKPENRGVGAVRAHAPVFGYPFNLREVLVIDFPATDSALDQIYPYP